jgi:hypothetical protein
MVRRKAVRLIEIAATTDNVHPEASRWRIKPIAIREPILQRAKKPALAPSLWHSRRVQDAVDANQELTLERDIRLGMSKQRGRL